MAAPPAWESRVRDERAVEEDLYRRLDRDFYIDRQVRGRLFGDPVRIDAVLRPKAPELWKAGDQTALGIEVKDQAALTGSNTVAAWVTQCIDYSYADWDGYGRLPIFAYPAVSGAGLIGTFEPMMHILGQFNVGEVCQHPRHGLALVMHQWHRIWSEARGVESGRTWRLRPRRGGRAPALAERSARR